MMISIFSLSISQVSATPGKTKHYQTHCVEGGTVTLADGPGLVIPDLSMSKVFI